MATRESLWASRPFLLTVQRKRKPPDVIRELPESSLRPRILSHVTHVNQVDRTPDPAHAAAQEYKSKQERRFGPASHRCSGDGNVFGAASSSDPDSAARSRGLSRKTIPGIEAIPTEVSHLRWCHPDRGSSTTSVSGLWPFSNVAISPFRCRSCSSSTCRRPGPRARAPSPTRRRWTSRRRCCGSVSRTSPST